MTRMTRQVLCSPQEHEHHQQERHDDVPPTPTNTFNATVENDYSFDHYCDDFCPQPDPHFQTAVEVVQACMETVLMNPQGEQGLQVFFNFASDHCRAALGGSLTNFQQRHARNPNFGYLVNCIHYEILRVGSEIPATPTRGTMQTILVATQPAVICGNCNDDNDEDHPGKGKTTKHFLWTLVKERRPPRQGFWTIYEVLYTKNAYQLTL